MAISSVLLIGMFLLIVVALNGFPLVFSDTGVYLNRAVMGGVPNDRPVFYSWFLLLSGVRLGWSVYLIPILQAAMSAVVLFLFLGAAGVTRYSSRLAIAFIIAVATSLPWFVGVIMPDVFIGIGVLSACMLLFGTGDHRWWPRVLLVVVFMCANLVHYSNSAIYVAGLSVVYTAAGLMTRGREEVGRRIKRNALLLILLSLFCFAGALSYARYHALDAPAAHFVVDRMTKQGITQKLLQEHCQDDEYVLCEGREEIDRKYLWDGKESPFSKMGGFNSDSGQSWRMVIDAIRYYPLESIQGVLSGTARQLKLFNTGRFAVAQKETKAVYKRLKWTYGTEFDQFLASRQQQREFGLMLHYLVPFHNWTVYLSVALLPWLYLRLADIRLRLTGVFFVSVVLANAAVCGVFSTAANRYQSRVIWLIPLLALVYITLVYGRRSAPGQAVAHIEDSVEDRVAGA